MGSSGSKNVVGSSSSSSSNGQRKNRLTETRVSECSCLGLPSGSYETDSEDEVRHLLFSISSKFFGF